VENGSGVIGGNLHAQKQGIFFWISVVTGAPTFWAEAASEVKGDGGGVASADFQAEVAGVISGRPGKDCTEEGGGHALAAGGWEDGYGVELTEVLLAVV
jgi:hypothetical protein